MAEDTAEVATIRSTITGTAATVITVPITVMGIIITTNPSMKVLPKVGMDSRTSLPPRETLRERTIATVNRDTTELR